MKPKLANILDELRFNFLTEEKLRNYNSDFDKLKQDFKFIEFIKKEIDEKAIYNSDYGKLLTLSGIILNLNGIDKESFKSKIEDPDAQELLTIVFHLLDQFIVNLNHLGHCQIIMQEVAKFFEKKKNKDEIILDMDLRMIYSIILDYYFVLEVKDILKNLNPEWKKIIEDMKLSIYNYLQNISKYSNLGLGEIRNKKSKTYIENNQYKSIYITPDMIDLLKEKIEAYRNFNDNIFDNSLNPELLTKIAELILNPDLEGFENKHFHKLNHVFGEKSTLTQNEKYLLIHELLVTYNHPSVISKNVEVEYYEVKYSPKEIRLHKIRKVKALLKKR